MNRNNELEKHLLSRSYESSTKISQLLETRYSITGGQKPIILFKQVGEPIDKQGKLGKLALLDETKDRLEIIGQNRIRNTRLELRSYIQQTLTSQRRLVKKIQLHHRTSTKFTKKFPIEKYLVKYEIPQFEEFVPLSEMWQQYMQNLLFPARAQGEKSKDEGKNEQLAEKVEHLAEKDQQLAEKGQQLTEKSQQFDSDSLDYSQLLPKLASADFNGCIVTVIQSKNTLLVGVRGIIVWDTQHSFIVVVPRDEDSREWNEDKNTFSPTETVGGFRMIPKKGSLFAFDVVLPGDEECVGFTMVGSRFEFRSVDRSGKKFKSHNVDDL